jgi:WD40 repeat protein
MPARAVTRRRVLLAPLIGASLSVSGSDRVTSHGSEDRAPGFKEVFRRGVRGPVNSVAWHPSGSELAILSGYGGQVTIWRADPWTVRHEFRRYGGAYSFNSLAYLEDGSLLICSPIGVSPDSRYATLEIFGLVRLSSDSGETLSYLPREAELQRYPGLIASMNTFTANINGSIIAGISKMNTVVLDGGSGSVRGIIATPDLASHGDLAASVALSPDGRRLAIGTGFGRIHLVTLADLSIERSIVAFPEGMSGRCGALAFSPDGEALAGGRAGLSVGDKDDGWVRVWKTDDGTLLSTLTGGGGSVRAMCWGASPNVLAVTDDTVLRVWSAPTAPGKPEVVLRQRLSGFATQVSPHGLLAVSDSDEVVVYRPLQS